MTAAPIEIVLVHGGFSDASVWRRVFPILRAARHVVSAAQLPLTGLADDARALAHHLASRSERVLLVGHSYGGLVITEASAREDRVRALAYVSSPVPPAGVPFGAFLQDHPAPAPVALAPDAAGYLWASEELVSRALGPDLSGPDRELFLAVQRPMSVRIYGDVLIGEGWRTRPTSYLVSRQDLVVSPAAQAKIATALGARTSDVDAGHLSPLSSPAAVAEFILSCARDPR